MIRLVALLTCIASLAFADTNRMPLAMLPATPLYNPVGSIFLLWHRENQSVTNVTVTNITSRTSIWADNANGVLFTGLSIGQPYVFLAYNQYGESNLAVATAAVATNKATISVYTYLVTLPVLPYAENWVMTSSNLLTWYRIATIFPTNSTHQIIWTNDRGNRYFRTVAP